VAKVFGEAHIDTQTGKYFYEIRTESGEVLSKSDAEFQTKADAENELVEILRGLGNITRQ